MLTVLLIVSAMLASLAGTVNPTALFDEAAVIVTSDAAATKTDMVAKARPVPPARSEPEDAISPVDNPTTSAASYTIAPGDSLWTIAQRFEVSVEALQAANPGLDPQALLVGQVIALPGATTVAAEASAEAADIGPLTADNTAAATPTSEQTFGSFASAVNRLLADGETVADTPLIPDAETEAVIEPLTAPLLGPNPVAEAAAAAAEAPVADTALSVDPLAPAEPAPSIALPTQLTSNVVPISITLSEPLPVELADLRLNGFVLQTYGTPGPYSYDLDTAMLTEGDYQLTFTVYSTNDVVSAGDLAFTVEFRTAEDDAAAGGVATTADLVDTSDLAAEDAAAAAPVDESTLPRVLLIDGLEQPFDLTFSTASGLSLALPDAPTPASLTGPQTLGEILRSPVNLVPPGIRDLIAAPRPGLAALVIIIMTVSLLPQGIFTLYYMLYTWNTPEALERSLPPSQADWAEPTYSFTALLPARKEELVIRQTIEAVNAIHYPDHLKEILILIRDEDDDETIRQAQAAIDDLGNPNIRLVTFTDGPKNKPNGLNKGLAQATGDVVCIFDAEDSPHPDIYQIVNTKMVADKADVVQAGVQLMNFESNWFSALNCLEYFFWFKSGLHCFTNEYEVTPLGGNTVFFKREWMEALGGWDAGKLTEDADVGLRLTHMGANIQIVYSAEHATQEETPENATSFIKQRTRWVQGFYEIFFDGEWLKLPYLKQKITALYILLNSVLQAIMILYLPIGVYIALTQQVSVPIALLSYVPIFMLLLQMVTNLVGIREFAEAYGKTLPLGFRLRMIVFYYPYQLMLSFAALRAMWRLAKRQNSWEKTDHSNLHRQQAAQQA